MKALLLENIHPEAVRLLEDAGLDVIQQRSALGEADLAAALPGVALLGIRSKTQVTAEVLAGAPDLLAVGAFCIGTDQIDLAAASALGVAVFNAPYSNTRSVVELTLAEIIALTRRLTEKDRAMHAGAWDKSAVGAHEVRGRTLGIVGYGNIGAQLSVVAEALGLRVVFYDTADKLALGNARRCVSLDELLEVSDVVSLHVDGRPANSSLLRREGIRPDAAGRPVPEPVPGLRDRPRRAAPAPAVRAPRRRRRRRLPGGAASRPATRSCPCCAGCRTSS